MSVWVSVRMKASKCSHPWAGGIFPLDGNIEEIFVVCKQWFNDSFREIAQKLWSKEGGGGREGANESYTKLCQYSIRTGKSKFSIEFNWKILFLFELNWLRNFNIFCAGWSWNNFSNGKTFLGFELIYKISWTFSGDFNDFPINYFNLSMAIFNISGLRNVVNAVMNVKAFCLLLISMMVWTLLDGSAACYSIKMKQCFARLVNVQTILMVSLVLLFLLHHQNNVNPTLIKY